MQFDSFASFIAMGGHALYVWLAYGSTVLVLIGSTVALSLAKKRQMSQLRWSAQAHSDDSHRTNRADIEAAADVEFGAEKI